MESQMDDVEVVEVPIGGDVRKLIFVSQAMRGVMEVAHQVASSSVRALIRGESGTGKELIARLIHSGSSRAEKPFGAINCAAIPEELLESELFGYEKGAFTGAEGKRIGLIPACNGGTFFLDEIGDLSPMLQAKLLRVLAEEEIMPVGSNTVQQVDVRFVSATNKDLRQLVEAGRFREDLYYRLSVVEIEIPPLRERPEDIPALSQAHWKHLLEEQGRQVQISREVLDELIRRPWSGNIRELQNALERMLALCSSEVLTVDLLPAECGQYLFEPKPVPFPEYPFSGQTLSERLSEAERDHILWALRTHRTKKAVAAALGISVAGLSRKRTKFNL